MTPQPGFLSRELTSFVGRETELQQVKALIDEGAPIVTVLGPPGIGKTRLALRCLSDQPAGVHSVVVGCDLRTARTTTDLIEELGRHLELTFGEATSVRDRIDAVTRGLQVRGRCLIGLDNFDALERSAVSAIQKWVRHAAGTQFLVTSRRLLVVSGEQPVELGPLPVPSGTPDWSCPSMQLFLDRAKTIEPSFSPTTANANEVGRLVHRLEGVPLAIELAASWMKRMDPREASEALRHSLLRLDGRRTGENPSHQSLRRAIASSWKLLSAGERTVAAQLSVFRRGFDLEAAHAVVRLEERKHAGLPSVIESLREASILRPADSTLGRRWDSYEAIREFAGEQLRDSAGFEETTRRHVAYFVEAGQRCTAQLVSTEADRAYRRLSEDRSNFRAAFEYASSRGDHTAVVPLALAVDASLRTHMPSRSVECLTQALDTCSNATEHDRARLLIARAEAHRNLGRLEYALEDLALVDSFQSDDLEGTAHLAFEWGRLCYFQGHAESALRHLQRALELTDGCPHLLHLRGRVHGWLGWCLAEACFDPRGFEHYERALECLARAGDPYQASAVRVWFACHRLFFQRGASRSDFEPILKPAEQIGDHLNRVRALIGLGCLDLEQERRPANALESFRRALSIARGAGLRREEGFVTMWHALATDELGDVRGASEEHQKAIAIADEVGDDRLSALNQVYWGGCLARIGDVERARQVLAAARRTRAADRPGDPMNRLVELQWGQVELAEARRARASGSAARFRTLTRRALHKVEDARGTGTRRRSRDFAPLATRTEAARILIRRVEAEHRSISSSGARVRVDRHALEFRLGDWPAVSLERSPVLRRVLLALVDAHAHRPGQAVTVDDLVASGWPEEHMRPESKVERVRNAVKRLRRAGLREVLLTRNGAFLLDPKAKLEWATAGQAQ